LNRLSGFRWKYADGRTTDARRSERLTWPFVSGKIQRTTFPDTFGTFEQSPYGPTISHLFGRGCFVFSSDPEFIFHRFLFDMKNRLLIVKFYQNFLLKIASFRSSYYFL
jgi:hypothetical protein